MADKKDVEQNRRRSVRVSDRILFLCESLSAEKYKVLEADFRRGIPLYNQEALADVQMYIGAQNALTKIRERDGHLADFLQHLDTKINLVLQNVRGESSPFDMFISQEVELSGAGMAFLAEKELNPDEQVELHLVLLPEQTYIYTIGRIVSCGKAEPPGKESSYRLAAEFTLIMEEDREKLIQHNFKQQSLALRNRRKGR